jgi:proteasome assembly chaperone 3
VEGGAGFEGSFPAVNRAQVTNADGLVTDIVCTTYDDYHFVNITQLQKMGTVIRAWSNKLEGLGDTSYEMSTLLGKRDDPLLDVYARQIIEKVSARSNKPLLLGVALKPEGRDAKTFQDILNKLFEIATWQ